jgi:hypothetical protein
MWSTDSEQPPINPFPFGKIGFNRVFWKKLREKFGGTKKMPYLCSRNSKMMAP